LKNRFWEPAVEKMSRKELLKLQDKRLRHILNYAYRNIRFYKDALKKAKVNPASIRSRSDLWKVPFTRKDDLRANYPFKLLATSMEKVCRVHTSSGTTGLPTVVAYTRNDLENWINCIARCLTMTGVTSKDVFQVILGYGLFTGGLGFHYGAERIGAAVVPSATGKTRRQIMVMKDFGVTAFTSIPSYTLYLAEVAQQQGINPRKDLNIRTISCGAESWSEGVRRKIENVFGCSVFNSYGLSEVCGPGVAFECTMQSGLHVWSDHFLVEVVDHKTGENLGLEEKGELVLTTLTREAMPLIRYRTGDIAAIVDENTCGCRRSHTKISWISGRTDDMIKVRGVNIFPSQVEHVLMQLPNVGNNYQLVVARKGYMDDVTAKIEVAEDTFRGELKELVALKEKLEQELENTIGLKISVQLVEPNSIPRVEEKAKRVLDLRE